MYNLLMTAGRQNWNNPTWVMPLERFLEYTAPAIASRFNSLNDTVVGELQNMPTLFAYERFLQEPARVGRITEIQRRQHEIKITFALDPLIPPILPEKFQSLYDELGISTKTWEENRTHWAIKDVDLASVLRNAGIATVNSLAPQPRPPKVFISYSWDSPEHQQWVAWLGTLLRHNGIDVTLDQWHLRGGEDLAAFMEKTLREADRVLVLCTENYVQKAMGRRGGVGYEHMMVTGALMQNIGTLKFIPIVRQSKTPYVLPLELSTRLYFDLSDGQNQLLSIEALVRELHDVRTPVPPIGINPYR